MDHLAPLGQLAGHPFGQVDRDREAQAGTGAGANQGVDADHLSAGIDQGATGIAGVDRRVGLDQVKALVGEAEAVDIAVQAAHDAEGHRALQAVGAAQGNRPVAHLEGLGIAQGGCLELALAAYTHHGQVGDRIGPYHAAVELAAIGEGHLNAVNRIDHVGVGEHQAAAGVDHHP